jgi:hypothetical protein
VARFFRARTPIARRGFHPVAARQRCGKQPICPTTVAAVASGRPELGQRRAKFGPIRSEQRILEFPSTAGRVVASVAEPGEPLETFVTYVISDDDDAFIVGRVMAEFERRGVPAVVRISDLERGDASAVVTPFTKAATLVNGEPLAKLFPPGAIDDRLVVL